jgi:hypothetical protein
MPAGSGWAEAFKDSRAAKPELSHYDAELNKQFGSSIIISESTKKSLTLPVEVESLGEAEIRGRQEPVKIYKVKA